MSLTYDQRRQLRDEIDTTLRAKFRWTALTKPLYTDEVLAVVSAANDPVRYHDIVAALPGRGRDALKQALRHLVTQGQLACSFERQALVKRQWWIVQ